MAHMQLIKLLTSYPPLLTRSVADQGQLLSGSTGGHARAARRIGRQRFRVIVTNCPFHWPADTKICFFCICAQSVRCCPAGDARLVLAAPGGHLLFPVRRNPGRKCITQNHSTMFQFCSNVCVVRRTCSSRCCSSCGCSSTSPDCC